MKSLQLPIKLACKYSAGAYTTQTVAGLRASSTSSAEAAVQGLVAKLQAQQGMSRGMLVARGMQAPHAAAGTSYWLVSLGAE